jgi:outer membrane protein assembly factor BamB
VIWACVPDADANKHVVTGRVFAFDASDFSEVMGDGDHRIKRLWMSDPDYTYNKFNVPVVNGGRLYVPTYAGTVDVYGV